MNSRCPVNFYEADYRRGSIELMLVSPESAVSWLEKLFAGLADDWVKLVIGAIAGWLLKVGRDRWRTRRARRFWRPFLRTGTTIVLGQTLDDYGWERSGLLGIGDAMALADVRQFLLRLGAKEPEVAFDKKLKGDDLKRTLILIGGPDANTATRDVVESIASSLRFGDPVRNVVSIIDTSTSPATVYPGTADDCGVIMRAKNPFAKAQEVLILAGSFGHGTLAAARHAISPEFLKQKIVKPGQPLECLVETDVLRDTPHKIRVKVLRALEESSDSQSAA
jgi:hypothetical protein